MTGGEDAEEVLAIVSRIGPVVLSAAVNLNGNTGSALRRAVGMMVADRNMVDLPTFGFAFNVCTDLARHCGATLTTLDRVRKAALKEVPLGLPAVQTVLSIVRLTLVTEARIVAYMTFRSREQVSQIAGVMHAAFSQTIEVASDDLDADTTMALTNLHGAVTKHLADRGRQLPRVVTYKYPAVMSALRMAQRAYTNPTRYLELIAENNVVHPLFMPRAGKMLAV
jgi:hypothetical protein